MLLVGKAGTEATRERVIAFADLARLPLAIATIPNGGRVLIEEEARRQQVALNIALEVNSVHVLKRLVARGKLFTIASLPSVAVEVAAGDLAVSRIVRPGIQQSFYLAIGGRRSPAAAVRVIAELIKSLCPSDPVQ